MCELAMYRTQSPAIADAVQRHHYQAHHAVGLSLPVSSSMTLCEAYIVDGDLETVRLLLDHGVHVEAPIDQGYDGFPVRTACEYGQLEILKLLVGRRAYVNGRERCSFGRSPLAIACHHGHFGIVVRLVENGALVNGQNLQGETPLVQAVYRGEIQIARYLISIGADAVSKLRPLKSAWYLAVKFGRLDILKCFAESRLADLTRDDRLQMHLLQRKRTSVFSIIY